jgi:hypothetical protein
MHTSNPANCTAISPDFPAGACRRFLRAVSDLREKLERRYIVAEPHDAELVRAGFAEAETLAWETAFPHLFLPLLAEEKIDRAFAERGAAQRQLDRAA